MRVAKGLLEGFLGPRLTLRRADAVSTEGWCAVMKENTEYILNRHIYAPYSLRYIP